MGGTVNDDPGALARVWPEVVTELTSDRHGGQPLTKGQKAWLALVEPLTLTQGFALLAVPSSFAQEAIERDLREPILHALGRHLGQGVEGLGVRISAPEEDKPDTERASYPETPSSPTYRRRFLTSTDDEPSDSETADYEEVDDDGDALTSVQNSWPTYFTKPPETTTPPAGAGSLNADLRMRLPSRSPRRRPARTTRCSCGARRVSARHTFSMPQGTMHNVSSPACA
jgi:chromosomal replication initiator protein